MEAGLRAQEMDLGHGGIPRRIRSQNDLHRLVAKNDPRRRRWRLPGSEAGSPGTDPSGVEISVARTTAESPTAGCGWAGWNDVGSSARGKQARAGANVGHYHLSLC